MAQPAALCIKGDQRHEDDIQRLWADQPAALRLADLHRGQRKAIRAHDLMKAHDPACRTDRRRKRLFRQQSEQRI